MNAMIETKRRRGRLFRRLFLGGYVAVAGTFSCLLFLGVLQGLGSRGGEIEPAGSLEACVERAAELRGELLEHLSTLARSPAGREGSRRYEEWASEFRGRLSAEKRGCSALAEAEGTQGRAVRETFQDLRRALDLSEIHATHWARHLGPALERSAASLEAARPSR